MNSFKYNSADTGLQRRILVADDDPILSELMQAKLSGPQVVVHCAENGAVARDKLLASRFDLAIIDLSMPALDGFELISYMRKTPRTMDMPVIVATSRNDEEAIQKSFAVGATTFITKPINWALFHHQVRFVLRNGEVERELRHARLEADLANRTKDNLFQLLGHELRTPLNVLVGFADVLKAELRKTLKPDQKEHLENMTDAAMRLNAVVGDVLTYSRLFSGVGFSTPGVCRISELIEDSLIMAKTNAAARNVRLLAQDDIGAGTVRGDRRQLLDGLCRLVDNAVKFSAPGAEVHISCDITADRSLHISVRDSGPGISPDRLEQCLKPFFQADMSISRAAEGLGLGLAIAKKICELHDGQLLIESAPGRGTTVTLGLPASRLVDTDPARLTA